MRLHVWACVAIRPRRDDLAARVSRRDTRPRPQGLPGSGGSRAAAASPRHAHRALAGRGTVTEWLELNTAPGHGIGGVCRRSSHRPPRGDEARSYDCDYEKLSTIRKGQ